MATPQVEVEKPQIAQVTEPRPKPSGYWDQWIGKEMVFQTKGRAIVTGTLKGFRNTFLEIESAKVSGTKYSVRPKIVMLDRNFISHFHEVCDLEPVSAIG